MDHLNKKRLFEGVNIEIFNSDTKGTDILESVDTDFNFLYVGHWLQGDLGHDRKDTGMMIKTFCTVFKSLPKNQQPGLILKTSSAGFSVMDREEISKKIKDITKEFGDKCPPIHLVFGDLSESELNSLYHSKKVNAMIMFTKGEGYGRPLAEFATTGKPIIVSDWSGYKDFLPNENTVYLEGELKNVHETASNKFLLKSSRSLAKSSTFTVLNFESALIFWDKSNPVKSFISISAKTISGLKKSILSSAS